ncbi:MAG: 30S ribosomal protein S8 [bacterium]
MSQDPIADFIAALKNGLERRKVYIDFPASKILGEILKIMKDQSFVESYKKISDRKQGFFRIFPVYEGNVPALKGAERVSKLGGRVYAGSDEIPRVRDGYGICIISTSSGIMEGEASRAANCGGEVICYLW